MLTLEGSQKAPGLKFAIVVSKFNDFVTERLQTGALEGLKSAGVLSDDICVIKVPGAFEIPFAAKEAATRGTLRRGHLPGLPDSRRDGALRVHRVSVCARHHRCGRRHRRADDLRRPDDELGRRGARAGGRRSGEQRLGSGDRRRGDGHAAARAAAADDRPSGVNV